MTMDVQPIRKAATSMYRLPLASMPAPGRTSSNIGMEKSSNPRLGQAKTKADFVDIMANLNLAYPKKIDVAVPANMRCGVPDVEEEDKEEKKSA